MKLINLIIVGAVFVVIYSVCLIINLIALILTAPILTKLIIQLKLKFQIGIFKLILSD